MELILKLAMKLCMKLCKQLPGHGANLDYNCFFLSA